MYKKLLFLAFTIFFVANSYSQLNVSYHQSNLPFIGVGYDINQRLTPELRLGTDQFISDMSLEAVLTYKFIKKEDYDFYGGLGYRVNAFEGLVAPVGLNFYPFNEKKFGFHIEAAPILLDADILRGSFGIHYRFL
ncbi:hypothetical protein [Salegentibacter salegens]|uniref:Outer membrane protein beta-barrel domain-containing protein n=1 Tax=Salegentibacter salegens TaxID=143223 RepID=A0A1M7LWU3_9FLAO|nr:hypothetical protein [Salegentibacter salegens]PRX52127.1 hypothetical protein LY58_00291 [Salegentibacter salegens]SHM82817.1 hypothetical protein SAMN05878281_2138 [Salegentibacter salegens]